MSRFAQIIVQAVAIVFDCAPSVQADWVAIPSAFGVAVVRNAIDAACLLCKCKQMRFAVGRVVPVVPGASVNAKGSDIGTRRMPGFV